MNENPNPELAIEIIKLNIGRPGDHLLSKFYSRLVHLSKIPYAIKYGPHSKLCYTPRTIRHCNADNSHLIGKEPT